MNFESNQSPTKETHSDELSMDDFDFRAITSGLGFHHQKSQDLKPVFLDKTALTSASTAMKTSSASGRKEMQVYQNDLSIFYGNTQVQSAPLTEEPIPVIEDEQKNIYPLAGKAQRALAFGLDLLTILGVLGIVMTVMARATRMDLIEVWHAHPQEITPLVLVLFAGFYLIYFSIFDKSPGSTLGKNVVGLKVVTLEGEHQSFAILVLRSLVTLTNFLSLGLFSWFDLQNKITGSKVIKVN